MRAPLAAIAGLMIPLSVVAAEPSGRFGWFANVIGSCWIGTFPDGRTQHAHCYTSQFDHFIRGTATLSTDRDGTLTAQFHGDSVFAWNENQRRIEYYIWGSDGNHGRHEAYYADEELVFPIGGRQDPEKIVSRSVWRRVDDVTIEVRREVPDGTGWKRELTILYRRAPLAQ